MHHGEEQSAWHMITGPYALWSLAGLAVVAIVVIFFIKNNKTKDGGE